MELAPGTPKRAPLSLEDAHELMAAFNQSGPLYPEDVYLVGVTDDETSDGYAIGIYVRPGTDVTQFIEENFGKALVAVEEIDPLEAQQALWSI